MLLVLVIIWAEIARSPEPGQVKLYFFDVGQGDSALIQRGDYQILIDGGPDGEVLKRIGQVMPITDRKIETVILSHPHADHLIGLNQVLERYEIGSIYFNGAAHTSSQYLEFLATIKAKNVSASVPPIGQEIAPFPNAVLEFLWPGEAFQGKTSCDDENQNAAKKYDSSKDSDCIGNLNSTSIVNRFCYFDQCSLFLGDLENDGQLEMLSKTEKDKFKAQILKVAHHGSSNGTNKEMILSVNPRWAVISVGADNNYGHPHQASLKLLSDFGIKILRTDKDGTIQFTLTESSIDLNK